MSFADIGQAAYLHPERLPVGEEPALEASAVYQPGRSTGAFSYATHACVLAVDPGTGHVDVLDYVVCHDCGTMVNPMIVEGQVVGGVAQGLGTALYEEIPYDENGQPLASTFLDYMIPGATEVPDVRVLHMETPSPHTRFGIKGMGEGGAIAPPAAIVNAINDALKTAWRGNRPNSGDPGSHPAGDHRRPGDAAMKPAPFTYHRASSIDDAIAHLNGGDAIVRRAGRRTIAGSDAEPAAGAGRQAGRSHPHRRVATIRRAAGLHPLRRVAHPRGVRGSSRVPMPATG